VRRLRAFDDWAGPEDPSSQALSDAASQAHRALIAEAGWLRRRKREAVYEHVRERVIELAAPRVPYKPERDPWYAPNAAVWSAGSIAGLMAVYRLCGTWPATLIERQWRWYRRGHWPAAYDDDEAFVIY
jgi:hypothetical protein